MNLKKTLFSAFAALALTASVMAPVAMAQTAGTASTTTASVEVSDGGVFNAAFCGPVTLSEAELTSAGDATSTGALEICYTDTKFSRPGFQVTVQAGDFTSSGNPNISASNFKLTTVYNTWQGQWGDANSNPAAPGDIGDIGGWAGTNQQVTDHDSPEEYAGGASLDMARYVAYVWPGIGTGSGDLQPSSLIANYPDEHPTSWSVVDGTYQILDVELTVPQDSGLGAYSSNLTLTIVAEEGYP